MHGTLVGNWYEEAKLKEETGQSRLIFPQHTKKSHKDLFDETKLSKFSTSHSSQQSTANRIFGTDTSIRIQTTNSEYGGARNPADSLPQIGRKHQLIQKQILQSVVQGLQEEEQEAQKKYSGDWFTTNQLQFQAKPIDTASLGKKRMCNQNGQPLPSDARDYDFLAQIGAVKRPPLAADHELRAAIESEDYAKQIPITVYTEKYNDGCIYRSEGSKANLFGRRVGKPLYL